MYGLQHGALAHTEQQAIKGPMKDTDLNNVQYYIHLTHCFQMMKENFDIQMAVMYKNSKYFFSFMEPID